MLKIKNKNNVNRIDSDRARRKKNKGSGEKYVQELLGIKGVKDNTIMVSVENTDTTASETQNKYYIRVNPKNINILPNATLEGLIDSFKKILISGDKIEFLVVDKTERIEDNKEYLKEHLSKYLSNLKSKEKTNKATNLYSLLNSLELVSLFNSLDLIINFIEFKS